MKSARALPFPVVCLLWAGILIGISFIESPVKFRTPTLTRTVAFDVGRTVFHASQLVQVGLGVLALGAALLGRVPRGASACLGAAYAALLLQVVWIFPELDARAQVLISGGIPTGPSHHALYAILEVVKLLALIVAAVLALESPRRVGMSA